MTRLRNTVATIVLAGAISTGATLAVLSGGGSTDQPTVPTVITHQVADPQPVVTDEPTVAPTEEPTTKPTHKPVTGLVVKPVPVADPDPVQTPAGNGCDAQHLADERLNARGLWERCNGAGEWQSEPFGFHCPNGRSEPKFQHEPTAEQCAKSS